MSERQSDVGAEVKAGMRPEGAMKVLAVVRSEEARDAFGAAFRAITGAEVDFVVGELREVDFDLTNFHTPDTLLLDVNLSDRSEIGTVESLVRKHGSTVAIVATASDAKLEGIRRLMRLGVTDFLPQPLSHANLLAALEHAARKVHRAESVADSKGKVLSFIKPLGGLGATTLAIQTACSLANRVKTRSRVCLLDLDLQFGNVAAYLDANKGYGVIDFIVPTTQIDGSFLRGLMSQHESGVDVLEAPTGLISLDALTPELATKLLDVACEEYDYIVIDMPLAWTSWTPVVLSRSDWISLITQLSVAALHQSRRLLDILAQEGLGEVPLDIVVNRFTGRWGNMVSVKEAEEALGRHIDHVIPDDHKTVSMAQNEGVHLSKAKRRSKVEKKIDDFIDSILGERLRTEVNAQNGNAAPRAFRGPRLIRSLQ